MRMIRSVGGVVLAGFALACGLRGGENAAPVPPAAIAAPETRTPAGSALDRLAGRWVREDGGYVLEVRSVTPEGRVDASYFNPNPIRVARAEAFSENGALTLFVELRAPNYPGSTYRLVYDAATDTLAGKYFQAPKKQTFDVSFVRR